MTRRRLVALVSVAVLFTLGLLVVVAVFFITGTNTGRERFRGWLQPFVASKIRGGTIYIGHLSGNFLTGISVDSLAIRDKRGELLASTGRTTCTYDPRDLIDNRIFVRRCFVEHPYVHLIQHANSNWNFKEIFASANAAPSKPKDPNARGWGDYVVFDSVTTRNGSFFLTMPWHPDDSLRGAVRDSVVRAHLTNPAKQVFKTFDGYGRRYAWTNVHGLISHARLADPDSDRTFGQQFRIDSLAADEYEPTFKFRNVTGDVRKLGDSAWFKVAHFDMPASTGSGSGKVWWGSDRPTRYDIAIRGDSVSLNDVNWVYPTLPRTGGGTLDLLIQNDPKNEKVVDFKLVKMDVRSTKSHLTGDMSFGTGAPLLLVRNVKLRADPVDFDLIRTLNGKPFPLDWQGQLFGTVTARGGPLTHFIVDDARVLFRDAHVRGAESRFSGRGELDILYPALTAFHGFFVDVASLDLRSLQAINPNFPRVGGTVSGVATLDSSYLDVRFSKADLIHRDGPGEPSHVTGRGRVTYGNFMVYDMALEAEALSLTTLARSYKGLPVRGVVSGPMRITGSTPDLEISTSLRGASGALSFDGHVDADTTGGVGVRGQGQFSALDLTTLLEKATIPKNTLNGHYEMNVDSIGANLAAVHGSATLALDRSTFDGIRVNPSRMKVRFADGQMKVDSLQLNSPAAIVSASGGIGLPNGRPDSLIFSMDVDSLGGLRFLAHPDSALADTVAIVPDSIAGSLTLARGVVAGTMDTLTIRGSARASGVYFNKYSAESAKLDFNLHDLPKSLAGSISLHADTATVVGVVLDSIRGVLGFADLTHAHFDIGAASRNGPTASATGDWLSINGANEVKLAALGFGIGESLWSLASPTRLTIDSSAIRLDSLLLRNRDSGSVSMRGFVPDSGAVAGEVRASRIPLRDLGILAQLRDTLSGVADLGVIVSGTKLAPVIDGDATLSSIKWGGIGIDRATATGVFRDARLKADADVVVKGQTAIKGNASLPIDLTLFSAKWGKDTLSGSLTAENADLSIVQPLFGAGDAAVLRDVTGRLTASVNAHGTPKSKKFDGFVSIASGSAEVVPAGITLSNIHGRVSGTTTASGQDIITVDSLQASTIGRPVGKVTLSGSVKNLLAGEPTFDLAIDADQIHALDKRSLADVYLTTTDPIRLQGTVAAPTLRGALQVDRTSIYLPDRDIARKQTVLFASDDTLNTTSRLGGSAMVSTLMTNLTPDITITLGNDVRLRSAEANVRLSGDLRVATSTNQSTRTLGSTNQLVPRLTLEGALRTEGGTYNLNLGLVQREFQVLQGGTVTFTPVDRPENPTLDIRAKHDIKQQGGDLGVIVRLHGPLIPYPEIDFSATGVDYEIPTSDLLSYLLTGKPGFDFGQNPQTSQVLASFLAPTASAFLSDRLRQTLGSWIDVFQFQLGGAGTADQSASAFSRANLSQYFYGTTIGAEWQFRNNLFLSVNTGFCQFSEANGTRNALNNLGTKIGYRFDPKLSMQLAYDPASATRACSGGQNLVGLVSPPPNFSFSFSHVWRF